MALKFIYLLLLVPFLSGFLVAFGGQNRELLISRIARTAAAIYAVATMGLLLCWILGSEHHLDFRLGNLYETNDYSFPIAIFIDSMSVTFLCLVAFLSNIIINFSRYYMHREPGYQKFFGCLLFLMFGLTLLTIAGTLDLLMAGWEFVGICSFLLISFYQTRLNSVRNAFKVLSVYKFCDVGLLLGAWLTHLLWHDTQFFSVLSLPETKAQLAEVGTVPLLILSCMILIAAAGKSAQWPFSFWLSRAMEGPTPSSAIFYGALSVHAGVLLLHRMHPIWSATAYGPMLVGSLGLLTAIVCTGIGRVQSNIKGQIAYSSAANVGIMFIEMAFNLKEIAMLHLVTNACLRCYQLLVSPSVMAYLLRVQGSSNKNLRPLGWSIESYLPPRIAQSLYVFCINDGYLENLLKSLIWRPITQIGFFLQRFDKIVFWILFPSLLATIVLLKVNVHEDIRDWISFLSVTLTLFLAMAAFAEKKSAIRAWNTSSLSALFAGLTILVLEPDALNDIALYGSGLLFFWVVGLQSLVFMSHNVPKLELGVYSGMATIAPGGAVMLFLSFLGVSGFPISPTYIGQDLLLHHAAGLETWLVFAIAASIVINGVSLARIYTKVCLGDPTRRNKSEFTYAA